MYTINHSDVIYRSMKEPFHEGVLACGFMKKTNSASSQLDFCIDYYSCFVILSGTGTFIDASKKKTHLEAGDFVQRLPGQIHSTEINPDGKWTEFFISFGKPVFDYLSSLNLINIQTPVIKGQDYDDFSHIVSYQNFLKSLKECDSKDLYNHLLTAQHLVINMQERALQSSSPLQQIHKRMSHEESITYARERLSTKFQENLDYHKLAGSLNMSYENFRKLFKSITGLSPAKYHTNEKMKQAVFMLSSGLSIREVAILIGYSDVYSFSKQFKKTTGTTPGYINRR